MKGTGEKETAGSRRADQMVPWTNPALEICLQLQPEQTVEGWEVTVGMSGRDGMGCRFLRRSAPMCSHMPHLCSAHARREDSESSESRLPMEKGGAG